jgi:hypothetical protein
MADMAETLEGLVDAHGVQHVVQVLAVIARAKGLHIEETWQDAGLAGAWNDVAGLLDATSQRAPIVRLAGVEGRTVGTCVRCGSVKPVGESCGCFDNGGQ